MPEGPPSDTATPMNPVLPKLDTFFVGWRERAVSVEECVSKAMNHFLALGGTPRIGARSFVQSAFRYEDVDYFCTLSCDDGVALAQAVCNSNNRALSESRSAALLRVVADKN